MQPFCEYVSGHMTEAINGLNEELAKKNIQLSDYKDILNGGVSFALTSLKLTLSDSDVENVSALPLLMAEIKGGSETLKTKLDDLQTKLETTFSSEEIAGNEFRRITGTNDDDVTLWVGASGSILYVTASQTVKRTCLTPVSNWKKSSVKPPGRNSSLSPLFSQSIPASPPIAIMLG